MNRIREQQNFRRLERKRIRRNNRLYKRARYNEDRPKKKPFIKTYQNKIVCNTVKNKKKPSRFWSIVFTILFFLFVFLVTVSFLVMLNGCVSSNYKPPVTDLTYVTKQDFINSYLNYCKMIENKYMKEGD